MSGQALTGQRSSTPKSANVKASDDKKVLWKQMGNNHAYPMLWADAVTMSGTSHVVASGIKFHGMDVATYANITATARVSHAAPLYVERDTVNNIVTIKSTASVVGVVDVQFILGSNAAEGFIADYKCRS